MQAKSIVVRFSNEISLEYMQLLMLDKSFPNINIYIKKTFSFLHLVLVIASVTKFSIAYLLQSQEGGEGVDAVEKGREGIGRNSIQLRLYCSLRRLSRGSGEISHDSDYRLSACTSLLLLNQVVDEPGNER